MEDMERAYEEFLDTLQSYLGDTKAEDPEEGMAERNDLRSKTLAQISKLKAEEIYVCLPSDLAAFASVCVGVRCINSALRLKNLEGTKLIDLLHNLKQVDGLPLVALKPEGKELLDKLLTTDQGREIYRDMACLLAEARKRGLQRICTPPCPDLSAWKVKVEELEAAGEADEADQPEQGAEACS